MQTLLPTNHESVFQNAWADPSNTRFELPPVNINEVLAEHYSTSEPLTFFVRTSPPPFKLKVFRPF